MSAEIDPRFLEDDEEDLVTEPKEASTVAESKEATLQVDPRFLEDEEAPVEEKAPRLQEPFTVKGSAKQFGAGFAGGAGGFVPDIANLLSALVPEKAQALFPAISASKNLIDILGVKGTEELTEGIARDLGVAEPQNLVERVLSEAGKFSGIEALTGLAGGPVGAGFGAVHGAATGVVSGLLKEAGVPEVAALAIASVATASPFAGRSLISKLKAGGFAELGEKVKGALSKIPNITAKTKPSGLPVRRFEKLKKPIKVTPRQAQKITGAVEQDVKGAIQGLIEKESLTARAVKADPDFPEKLEGLFEDTQRLVGKLPEKNLSTADVLRSVFKRAKGKIAGKKGITLSEAEKAYIKEFNRLQSDLKGTRSVSNKQLLEQYRKNNSELGTLFEPGKSKGVNLGKRDALVDYNRAIGDIFEGQFPDSAFNDLFKFTNKRYSELIDLQNIDGFFDTVFNKGKINFNNARKFSKQTNARRSFERILGKDSFKEYEAIMKDFVKTEQAHALIKRAEFLNIPGAAKLFGRWAVSPLWAKGSFLFKGGKFLKNEMLSNRSFRLNWDKGLLQFKQGKLKEAAETFKKLDKTTEAFFSNVSTDKDFGQSAAKGKATLGEVSDVNPKFLKKGGLKDERQQFIEQSDLRVAQSRTTEKGIPTHSAQTWKLRGRNWDKILSKESFDNYYFISNTVALPKLHPTAKEAIKKIKGSVFIGYVGDFLKEGTNLSREFKEIANTPVFRIPKGEFANSLGVATTVGLPGAKNNAIIAIKGDLSPFEFRSALAHEGTHIKQGKRLAPIKQGSQAGEPRITRLINRHFRESEVPYLNQLNEIHARKFQRWINLSRNRFASTLEKGRKAHSLLHQQQNVNSKLRQVQKKQ